MSAVVAFLVGFAVGVVVWHTVSRALLKRLGLWDRMKEDVVRSMATEALIALDNGVREELDRRARLLDDLRVSS